MQLNPLYRAIGCEDTAGYRCDSVTLLPRSSSTDGDAALDGDPTLASDVALDGDVALDLDPQAPSHAADHRRPPVSSSP